MNGWTRLLIAIAALCSAVFTSSVLQTAQAEVLYGIRHDLSSPYVSTLITFDSAAPSVLLSSQVISGGPPGSTVGLPDQFTITGIDFRPSTGQLYGVANRSGFAQRAYVIDPSTGAATLFSNAPFLNGSSFGFDADPIGDVLRLTSDVTSLFNSSSNNRLNPDTGGLIQDVRFSFAAGDPNFGDNPQIMSVAYTNSLSNATTTTLFGIDAGNDILVRVGSPGGSPTSPNTGELTTIGSLGVLTDATSAAVGMEISGGTGIAYAAILQGGLSHLFSLDLATGAATDLGLIGTGATVYDLASIAIPESSSCLLLAGAAVVATGARWIRRFRCFHP
jgi:hypothetical protein